MNLICYVCICEMFVRRQFDLIVCMEQVYKFYNVFVIICIVDVVGVYEVYVVWFGSCMCIMVLAAVGSNSWVQVKIYCIIGDVVVYFKGQGMQILVIYFFDNVVDFCEIDYICLICILMGQEKMGIMQEVLVLVDQDIIILMIGMVQLLNVFVVLVFIFYEVQCQR